MSLRFNGVTLLLIAWQLTWLLITVCGSEHIKPEAIPLPPFWKPQATKRDLECELRFQMFSKLTWQLGMFSI